MLLRLLSVFILLLTGQIFAQVPQIISYQGRVLVGSLGFEGSGQFKFALVDGSASSTYWSNDGTSAAGSQPSSAVTIAVTKGIYSVVLGDTTLGNMQAIPASAFAHTDVRLRVWFNDGTTGWQQLAPDQRVAAVGYALIASSVDDGAITAAKIAAGAIGTAQLAANSVTSAKIAAGTIGTAQLAANSVTTTQLAANSVTSTQLAANSVTSAQIAANSITGAQIAAGTIGTTQIAANAVTSAQIATGAVGSSQLASGVVAANLSAANQSAVGSGGVVLSASESTALAAAGFVKLGSMSLGDGWQLRSNGSPSARSGQSVIWTGTEMLVWGGYHTSGGYFADGARYNPTTNTWAAVNPSGAPSARHNHSAVWTGTEMIVWGGYNGSSYLGDGARYNPTTDSWSAVASTSTLAERFNHAAVWTGSLMVVWGGYNGVYLNSGATYNPTTGVWAAMTTTNAPSVRRYHAAVWNTVTSEMLVWGGYNGSAALGDGGAYNPSTGAWSATSSTNAPSARYLHTAVWSGTEMLVWGGYTGSADVATGAKYNPASKAWTTLSTTNAPLARDSHSAVWNGSAMLVWGGGSTVTSGSVTTTTALSDGSLYNPTSNTWSTTSATSAPAGRYGHSAIWSGTEMILWGGGNGFTYFPDGARYNSATSTWGTAAPACPLSVRANHTAIWTGSEMLVWGGFHSVTFGATTTFTNLADGARYNPKTNVWTVLSTANAPSARYLHSAVWSGTEMLVWGGCNTVVSGTTSTTTALSSGARYNPTSDTWTALPATNAPSARYYHTAVWSGTEMIVWGGYSGTTALNTGAKFNPISVSGGAWTATGTLTGVPFARSDHTAVWTGTEMLVWGGYGGATYLNTGARYNPNSVSAGSWTAMGTLTGVPTGRSDHTALWTGSEMLVWGGYGLISAGSASTSDLNDGAAYTPSVGTASDYWTATSSIGTPASRSYHSAVWTGTEMLVWGGYNNYYLTAQGQGGRYAPLTGAWNSTVTAGSPASRSGHSAVWTGSEMLLFGGYNGGYLNDTYSYTVGKSLYLYQRP